MVGRLAPTSRLEGYYWHGYRLGSTKQPSAPSWPPAPAATARGIDRGRSHEWHVRLLRSVDSGDGVAAAAVVGWMKRVCPSAVGVYKPC